MKSALAVLVLTLAFAITGFAQTPAAPAAPAATPALATVPVTPAEASAITTAYTAFQAAQVAESANMKALLAGNALTVAAGAQTALHAATLTAFNQVKAALDTCAANHAIDQTRYQYSVTSAAWVPGHPGGNRNGLPLGK
jgi:hypothetical protein